MPTKANVDKLDALQVSLGQMVELKKAVDRIEGEIRTVQKRKEMLVGGPEEEMEGDAEVKKEEGESRVDRESSIRVSLCAGCGRSVGTDDLGFCADEAVGVGVELFEQEGEEGLTRLLASGFFCVLFLGHGIIKLFESGLGEVQARELFTRGGEAAEDSTRADSRTSTRLPPSSLSPLAPVSSPYSVGHSGALKTRCRESRALPPCLLARSHCR